MYNKKEEVILRVFDKFSAEFEQNSHIIFKSINEKSKMMYDLFRNKDRIWESSNKCLFYDCEKQSIKRSHTLQKSGVLSNISDNNHLLTPLFNRKSGKTEISKIGINYASTFPGFCKEHEGIFSVYERRKKLSSNYDIALQIFRTIARELFVIKHYSTCFKDELNNYIKFRSQRIKEILEDEFKKQGVSDVNVYKVDFDNIDRFEILCKQKIAELLKRLTKLEEFYAQIGKIFDSSNDTKNTVASIVININIVIPVALSGMGNYWVEKDDKSSYNVVCMLNVIPQEKNTLIVITTLIEHEESLKMYLNSFGENGYISYKNFIQMIESWMIFGTDHWFISPSVWNENNDFNKEFILNEMRDMDKNISNKFSGDIFRKLKLHVEHMETENNP